MTNKNSTLEEVKEGDRLLVEPVYQMDFDPAAWKDLGPFLTDCYGYGLGLPFIGVNGLGNISSAFEMSASPETLTIESLKEKLAKRDGLQMLDNLPNDGSHVLAIFYGAKAAQGKPGYHCYCRNTNGLWSHLHSGGDCNNADRLPTQTDFSGDPITDPHRADRGAYNEFVGYAAIPYGGLLVRPKISLQIKDFPPLEKFTIRAIPLLL
ncbi:MAG: hypothetical protein HYS17_05995 [Micavibrio aeruginosavorus]|uniref:Uncharacterized protein n=1 Tax=Micavibrio aeruginosavorus TaxID=349221 RepID=A0A7T5R4C0_9BACT|nr:MAG: hypothetical protein HYS17_05995 [Micavibrio aeruginosavorus]